MSSKKVQELEALVRKLELAVSAAAKAREYGIMGDLAEIAEKVWQKIQGHEAQKRRKKK